MTRYRTIASAQKMTASRGVFDAIDLRARPADEFPSPISTPLRASNALLYELSETPVCGGGGGAPRPPALPPLRDRLRVPHRGEARDRPDLRAEVVVPEEGDEEVPDLVPLVLEEVPEPAEGDHRGRPDGTGLGPAGGL